MTNDTWGLNFTSPIDAKQFRECCVSIKSFCNINRKINNIHILFETKYLNKHTEYGCYLI